MRIDIETLTEFLITAGLCREKALTLPPDQPLPGLGVGADVLTALAELLSRHCSAPTPDQKLLQEGALEDWAAHAQANQNDDATRAAAMERILAEHSQLPSAGNFSLEPLRPQDAPGATRLLHLIYGDSYPIVDYYVPERLLALNRQRLVITLVGLAAADGQVAGQGALFRSSSPNPHMYEMGQITVAPAFRTTSLGYRLYAALVAKAHALDEIAAFYGEAVLLYMASQKPAAKYKTPPCGVELSLMPAGSYEREGAVGRVSCLLSMGVKRDQPHTVHLPECCRTAAELVLSLHGLARDVRYAGPNATAAAPAPGAEASDFTTTLFNFAQVARTQVPRIGRDLPARLDELAALAQNNGLKAMQVLLNAAEPATPYAVDELRRRGYIFCCYLPLWFGTDGLAFQWLDARPNFDVPVFEESAKQLLALIKAEWEARAR